MTRKLSNEEKAARAVARRAALARRKTSCAEAAAVTAQRFNARSTRASVRRSVLTDATLTIEEYQMAVARDLVGSGLTNESLDALPIAYDGPHQVRWDAASWQGFTRMSSSRQINNATDTDPVLYDDDYEWPDSNIDDEVVAQEDIFNRWADDAYWESPPDVYDVMSDRFGGSDLTEEGYEGLRHPPSTSPYR